MTELTDPAAQIPQSSPGVSTDRARPIKYKMPVIPEQATPQWFVDEIGKFSRARGRVKKAEDFLKEAFKARWPKDEFGKELAEIPGEVFDLKRTSFGQVRISSDLAREKLTPEQLASISYNLVITQMRFKKKAEGWDDLSDDEIDALEF